MARHSASYIALVLAVGLVVLLPGGALGLTPNDPEFWRQWAYPKMEATRAWDMGLGMSSVVIAVLDTGADFAHPDLQNGFWTNPNEVPNNNIDDDGNGYVDDVRGWDFVNADNDPQDDHVFTTEGVPWGHGTHVTGIAAARTNNRVGVAGTAQVSIMVLKVLDERGNGEQGYVTAALEYARLNGARIVSMSISFFEPCSQSLTDELTTLWNAGLLIVAAAGNQNADAITCPANHPRVIPVGATTSSDLRWTDPPEGSNYGTHLRNNGLVAPGKDIYSTMISSGPAGVYGYLTGTSMAAPFVAGVAGLILSRTPGLTNAQVKGILLNSADDIAATGPDIYTGYGRLNALRAVLGAGDQPYVKITYPAEGEMYPPGSVAVGGYVRKSALTPTRPVQQVLVDISNKACGVFPNWREAPFLEWDPERWAIQYFTDGFPDCDYYVSAKAWDGVNWSNFWTVKIRIQEGPPFPF